METTTVIVMCSATARVIVRTFEVTDDLEERVEKLAELEGLNWSDCEWMSNVAAIDIQY